MDRQELEDELIMRAGASGGEILNELGMIICKKKDTADRINKQQWMSVVRSILGRHAELLAEYEKRERELDDEIPF